jgi:hypothetical protein
MNKKKKKKEIVLENYLKNIELKIIDKFIYINTKVKK